MKVKKQKPFMRKKKFERVLKVIARCQPHLKAQDARALARRAAMYA